MLAIIPAECAGQSVAPIISLTANALGNPVGGQRQSATYTHQLVGGLAIKSNEASNWQLTASGAWTAGKSLSAIAIGDTSGVQGTFNGGNGLWLYQLELRRSDAHSEIAFGRLAASDSFGSLGGFANFVNAAFSSNGGAISTNDPGRATSPSSTWGATAKITLGQLTIKAGAFLSDPDRYALRRHGANFAFRPHDGVIGMAEASIAVSPLVNAGLGAYHDTAPVTRFDDTTDCGNNGLYAWVERPSAEAGPSLFAMAQIAPQSDRNIYPLFLIAGATWSGQGHGRPDDSISIGGHAGRFSHDSGRSGWEAVAEINYQYKLTSMIMLQPDLQYIINPGGTSPNAIVVGAQISFHL